jgi:hypothetical protein
VFLVQYVIEFYCCYKLLLMVSENTDALLHSTRVCVYVFVCASVVCVYVVFNIALASISAKDVKSRLHQPVSENKTQSITILSLFYSLKNRFMRLLMVSCFRC